MLIVAVAWIYVVGLMALTEPTVVAGIVTFLFYCVLPLSTLIYISGTGKRKARRRAEEQAAREARQSEVTTEAGAHSPAQEPARD
ncbi:hypothetical protein ACFFKC_09550 [Pseudoduganella danionis]|uniref:Transmembrane protein n=1 Tax=Pseudoduganella danionis TaxID=1890295 RepID=A0ABW9SKN5_9BURK|nr:hypothetical protein [Pseudoduganella danionis]MTW32732.1 hypothetical protein [Pseudoduganella danionis]